MSNHSKPRVLLCGIDDSDIPGLTQKLSAEFDLQTAGNSDIVGFLMNEWEPQICVLQADNHTVALVSKLRQTYPYSQLGIIVVAEINDPQFAHKESSCFRSGTDHFISQSADPTPILMRVRSLLKKMRASHQPESKVLNFQSSDDSVTPFDYGPITIYPQDYLVKVFGDVVPTTPTQFKLLVTFLSNQEQLLSRAWLQTAVWGDSKIAPRTIDAQISKLKRNIPYLERVLINVYGKGYILTDSQSEVA